MAITQVPTNFQASITSGNSPVVLDAAETHGELIKGLFVANQGLGSFQLEISSDGDAYGDPIVLSPGDEYEYNATSKEGDNVIVDKVRLTFVDSASDYLVSVSSIQSMYSTGVRETEKLPLTVNTQKDSVDPLIEYVGVAQPGSLTSLALWQIRRVDCTTGTVVLYADGDANYNNIFDDRESLTYS